MKKIKKDLTKLIKKSINLHDSSDKNIQEFSNKWKKILKIVDEIDKNISHKSKLSSQEDYSDGSGY